MPNNKDHILEIYLKSIKDHPILTREEERKYLLQAKREIEEEPNKPVEQRNYYYRNLMINYNQKILITIANKKKVKGLNF